MTRFNALVVAVAWAGCGGGETQLIQSSPVAPPPDPLAAEKARFQAAYEEVGCIANRGYDPDGGLVRLEDPVTFSERMRADASKRWPLVERALGGHGFSTIEELKTARTALSQGDPAWWAAYQGSFPDRMGACAK